jgi:hypothetical protein
MVPLMRLNESMISLLLFFPFILTIILSSLSIVRRERRFLAYATSTVLVKSPSCSSKKSSVSGITFACPVCRSHCLLKESRCDHCNEELHSYGFWEEAVAYIIVLLPLWGSLVGVAVLFSYGPFPEKH